MLPKIAKKAISMCIAAFMVLFSTLPVFADSWSNHTGSGFAGGSGLASDPYQISNAQQLALLAKTVNNSTVPFSKCVILTQDIHLTGSDWMPIGLHTTDQIYFDGTFDGNGKTIDGLAIGTEHTADSTIRYPGLFGIIGKNATVKNVKLSVAIYSAADRAEVGALAGRNTGHITNCHVGGTIVGPGGDLTSIGGLAGVNNGVIENSDSSSAVTGGSSASIGGLVGYSYTFNSTDATPVSYTNCHANGNVTGSTHACLGGLIGQHGRGNITDCYATGKVTGRQGVIGGLLGSSGGEFNSYDKYFINRCYATGDVTDTGSESGTQVKEIGGFAGEVIYETILNSFATGNVSVNTDPAKSSVDAAAGGFAGYTDCRVYNCFAAGAVTGGKNANLGGFIAEVYNSTKNGNFIENCFAAGGVLSNGDQTSSENEGGFSAWDEWNSIANCYWNQSAQQTYKGQPVSPKIGVFPLKVNAPAVSKTESEMKSAAFLALLNSNRSKHPDWIAWEQGDKINGFPYLPLMKDPTPTPTPTSTPASSHAEDSTPQSTLPSSTVTNPQTGGANLFFIPATAGFTAFALFAVCLVLLKAYKSRQGQSEK